MKNKKKFITLIFLIAAIVFVGLYFVLNYSEPSILNSKDKKWVQANGGKLVDVAVINDIPIYSNDGDGVVFDYLDYLTDKTTLEFNKVPYLKESTSNNSTYKFEYVDGFGKLDNNQLLIYTDNYIALSKKESMINEINDFKGMTLGVFKGDIDIISYYLKSINNIKYNDYQTAEDIFKGLDNGEVNMILVPYIMYLDKTINSDYYINYFFTDISKKLVLTMNGERALNDIFRKGYDNWFNDFYVTDYNKLFLNYYIEKNNINDKTRADLLSKTYIYGYVDNRPYEFSMTGNMNGIAIEYINRIKRFTDIDVTYQKYNSIEELTNAINSGEVDIYFDYINCLSDKYLRTKSVFIEKYVVLGKENIDNTINSLESLRGRDVNLLDNEYLYHFIVDNTMANVSKYDDIDKLVKNDNLIIIDKEKYDYYRNDLFKDYEVLYSDMMTNNYAFMIKSSNDSFFNLFNYVINTNSYYNYRNNAYINFSKSIFDRVSFEELYLIILAIVLIPIIIGVATSTIVKNKHKIRIIRREDRKKYMDMLTSLKNRNYLNLNIEKWNNNKKYPQTIIVIDLNNMKYINDNYGREKGDSVIIKAASILVNAQLENSEIMRSDGNEFLIYMVGYNENQIDIYTKKLSKSFKDLPYGFGAAIGYSMITDNIKTIDDAINEATIEMQSDKESYK